MSFFHVSLDIALLVCLAGTLYRIYSWFTLTLGPYGHLPLHKRVAGTLKSTFKVIFSARLGLILKSIALDSIFQVRLLKTNFLRWLIHMSIFWGFVILILMHALDDIVTTRFFSNYASTLNPYFVLRNVLGLMVMAGGIFALARRLLSKKARMLTHKGDIFALILIMVIVGSGFLLESTQIISEPIFNQMVDDYWGPDDVSEVLPLKAYWEKHFYVVFAEKANPVTAEVMDEGKSLHQENCAACHSSPQSAFISLPIAKRFKALGQTLNAMRADTILWYIHFLATFLGLACLPFSKLFHIFTTPLQLAISSVEAQTAPLEDEGPQENKRLLALDACTHCGVCSRHCSVATVFKRYPNRYILPSEKVVAIKHMIHKKSLAPQSIEAFAEGSFICTDCQRCTQLCPSGINLQDLWYTSKARLVQNGYPEPYHWIQQNSATQWADKVKTFTPKKVKWSRSGGFEIRLTNKPQNFSSCVQCTTCTNVCPVVAASEDPSQDLDFTPQQIMNLLRLELRDAVLGSRMVWNCLTCYMCQEHCPQGVRVTDVLYELRNQAYEKFKTIREKEAYLTKK